MNILLFAVVCCNIHFIAWCVKVSSAYKVKRAYVDKILHNTKHLHRKLTQILLLMKYLINFLIIIKDCIISNLKRNWWTFFKLILKPFSRTNKLKLNVLYKSSESYNGSIIDDWLICHYDFCFTIFFNILYSLCIKHYLIEFFLVVIRHLRFFFFFALTTQTQL